MVAKVSESLVQQSFFQWVREQKDPIYRCIFATSNQGSKGKQGKYHTSKLKKEGMSKGVPDIFIDVARGGYHGLRIELKLPRGSVKKEQKEWIKRLNEQGFLAVILKTANPQELIDYVQDYLNT